MNSETNCLTDLPDRAITGRERSEIAALFHDILPSASIIAEEVRLRPYESDGLTSRKQLPMLVLLPETTEQVAEILKICLAEGLPVVPRGAGTSLSGGATPVAGGIVLGMAKFNQVLAVDLPNRLAVVQPGVTNLGITKAVEDDGFYYAPDPSSQIACTIGGNVAENSGGVHCLKYGLTTNNILGLECVLMDGTMLRLGGRHLDAGGLDLQAILTGSEGLLAVVTEVTVRLLPRPELARAALLSFNSSESSGECVAAIIAAGIIPAGIEMMDAPAIQAAEAFAQAGYPLDAEAILIVELDGPPAEVDFLLGEVSRIARENGATAIRESQSEEERQKFWAGRKAAFPAIGRLSPDYLCMDGTIPRRELAPVLGEIRALSARYGLRVANVFHAGDGNLHPLIMFDANKAGEVEKAEEFGLDILRACVAHGGVLSGEHGIGIEKKSLMGEMFTETDLAVQRRVKCAFDGANLLNPGKMFPSLHRCADHGWMKVSAGKLPFPDLPRF